jgi:hypothetical protein
LEGSVATEHIGEEVTVYTDDHPPRKDSAEYLRTRKWLVGTGQGCIVCGGEPIEDHHGGGITVDGVLVALNLFPLEWSQGWGADPAVVARQVAALNPILAAVGEPTYDQPVTSVDEVMAWVDSTHNASVPICKPHHTGHQTSHTPDARGHEACGIHEVPLPIWAGQITCDWDRFDMWAGSTGTVAVAPVHGTKQVHVLHAHPSSDLVKGQVLPAHHPHARLAHAGAHVDRAAA